jgi:hypothetical protein
MDSWLEELPIRPVTKQLVNRLLLDLPLPTPVIVDFGVDSEQHYRALKEVLSIEDERDPLNPDEEEAEVDAKMIQRLRQRIVELDEALGNGALLDAMVKKYAPQYAKIVHFQTSWDVIYGRTDKLSG